MAGTFKNVGLLHHMGGGNLGDDGTFDAVMRNIKERWPEAAIVGLTMNPDDTRTRHGIPSYAIRQRIWSAGAESTSGGNEETVRQRVKHAIRGHPVLFGILRAINYVAIRLPQKIIQELLCLATAVRIARSLDLLIISGGGQLIESSGGPWVFLGGPLQFPFTIFKWVLIAKLAGAKCVVLNVGAGPLVTHLGKFFVRRTLALADYASFRDEDSRALVHNLGVKRETHHMCDSAYSLDTAMINENPKDAKQNQMNVGLAPMAYGDPRLSPKHDPAVYNDYIRRIAEFAAWLIKSGYCVTLFCTDIGIDPPAILDLEEILKHEFKISSAESQGVLRRVHQWSTRELLDNMSSMDYAVVCRFHAVVFAHLLNIPVLAINHHPKVRAQMTDVGLSEYCVDMENCGLETLKQTFMSLTKNRDEVKHRMAEKLACYKSRLADQFDALFPPQAVRDSRPSERPAGQLAGGLAWVAGLFGAGDSVASQMSAKRAALRFVKQLEQCPRGVLITTALLMVASIGFVDYITGFETSYAVFYLLAIGFTGWFVGRSAAMVISVVSVTVSLLADLAGGAQFSSPLVPVWNGGVLMLLYLVVIWLLTSLRSLRQEVEVSFQQRKWILNQEKEQGS